MKTKDFIKMLQEADPTGEAHIRMEGGIPIEVSGLPGYYDGNYNYLDDDGNYIISRTGTKVDIHTMNLDDFVEEHFDLHDPDNYENIKSKIIFEGLSPTFDETSFYNKLKKSWDSEFETENHFFQESKKEALENTEKGWKWFQNKLVDTEIEGMNPHHYYTWLVLDENKKQKHSNEYTIKGVYKSNLFERLDNNKIKGYYEWVLKKIK